MYLLDTNVVSELRRPRPHRGVLAWIEAEPDDRLFVSAVTAAEIQTGVEITRGRDPAKADEIEAWLESAMGQFSFLPMDVNAFRLWAVLMHGRSDAHAEDAMIAASALVNGLTVVTRNATDFAPFGVETLNPFEIGRAR